jgi:uncharacterized iron-regulated membrane protein
VHDGYPYVLFGLLALLALLLPLFGASMLLVWLIERGVLRRSRRASAFLGLAPSS